MSRRAMLFCFLLFSPVTLPTALAQADEAQMAGEQKKRLGNYDVHYSAFNSTFLPTQVARSYGITRSRYTGVLNVSVHDRNHDDNLAVNATITGTARNLLGNEKQLTFNRVQEGSAIYYLSEFSFSNEETFRFTLDIQPPDGSTQQLKFQQKFYAD